MKKKLVGIFIAMLLITILLPITVIAGDKNNPELEDKIRDVKLFGIINWFQKSNFKYIDIVSTWFTEESTKPDYLSISLQLRDLEKEIDGYNAFYSVGWSYDNNYYMTSLQMDNTGINDFKVGISNNEDDIIDFEEICDGSIDYEENVITWIVPKSSVENTQVGSIIYNINPYTYIQLTSDSIFRFIGLFKDLSWNAKTKNEYTIQY